MVEFKIEGMNMALKRLGGLGKKVENNVLSKAEREALKISHKKAKANAKNMVGGKMGALLARALTIHKRKRRRKGEVSTNILFNKSYNDVFVYYSKGSQTNLKTRKTTGKRSYIPSAIEYGHKVIMFGKDLLKKAAPIPFYHKAWEETKYEVLDRMLRATKEGVEKAASNG